MADQIRPPAQAEFHVKHLCESFDYAMTANVEALVWMVKVLFGCQLAQFVADLHGCG